MKKRHEESELKDINYDELLKDINEIKKDIDKSYINEKEFYDSRLEKTIIERLSLSNEELDSL